MVSKGTGNNLKTSGDYRVRFIDYNGTILQDSWVNSGESIEAPNDPAHTGLSFQGWNYSSSSLSNVTYHMDVGAMYNTSDGKTKLTILLTNKTGLSPTIYLKKTDTSTLSIDWGDGGTITTTTTNGNVSSSHTYSAIGKYIISIWISSGSGEFHIGDGTNTFVGGSAYKSSLFELNIGSNVTRIQASAFNECGSLTYISIPQTVTTFDSGVFTYIYSLRCLIVPINTTTFNFYFLQAYALSAISIPKNITTVLAYNSSQDLFSLTHLVIPFDWTKYPSINGLYSLDNVYIHSNITTLGGVYNLNSISTLNIPSTVTTISGLLGYCYGLKKVIANRTTPPTLSAGMGLGLQNSTKIYVPNDSVSAYKSATNWSTAADYIYSIDDMEE